jgi:transposase
MFYNWLKYDVRPYCTPFLGLRSVLVMDNASTHRNGRIAELIKDVRCRIEYLLLYLPDFNPIERSFHDLKAYIRRHRRELELFSSFGNFLQYCLESRTLFRGAAVGYFARLIVV